MEKFLDYLTSKGYTWEAYSKLTEKTKALIWNLFQECEAFKAAAPQPAGPETELLFTLGVDKEFELPEKASIVFALPSTYRRNSKIRIYRENGYLVVQKYDGETMELTVRPRAGNSVFLS